MAVLSFARKGKGISPETNPAIYAHLQKMRNRGELSEQELHDFLSCFEPHEFSRVSEKRWKQTLDTFLGINDILPIAQEIVRKALDQENLRPLFLSMFALDVKMEKRTYAESQKLKLRRLRTMICWSLLESACPN